MLIITVKSLRHNVCIVCRVNNIRLQCNVTNYHTPSNAADESKKKTTTRIWWNGTRHFAVDKIYKTLKNIVYFYRSKKQECFARSHMYFMPSLLFPKNNNKKNGNAAL